MTDERGDYEVKETMRWYYGERFFDALQDHDRGYTMAYGQNDVREAWKWVDGFYDMVAPLMPEKVRQDLDAERERIFTELMKSKRGDVVHSYYGDDHESIMENITQMRMIKKFRRDVFYCMQRYRKMLLPTERHTDPGRAILG